MPSAAENRAQYLPLVDQAAARYGIPASLVRAVVRQESNWTPGAYRSEPQIQDASRGLMQLLYSTAKSLGYGGTPLGLYDPALNVDLGAHLLRDNIRRASVPGRSTRDAEDIGLSAYNAGFSTIAAAELARQGRLFPDGKRDSAGKFINQPYVDSVRRFQAAELGTPLAPAPAKGAGLSPKPAGALSSLNLILPIGIFLGLAVTVAATRPTHSR